MDQTGFSIFELKSGMSTATLSKEIPADPYVFAISPTEADGLIRFKHSNRLNFLRKWRRAHRLPPAKLCSKRAPQKHGIRISSEHKVVRPAS